MRYLRIDDTDCASEEEHLRVQELQQQEQDLSDPYSICGQVAVSGAAEHEYCG